DPRQVEELAAEVRYRGAPPVSVHLKLDTGMARLGMLPADLPSAAAALQRYPEIRFQALMTHFASADTNRESIREQLAKFDEATACLRDAGVAPRFRHAANTAALLRAPESHLDMVRPGIGVFGVQPSEGSAPELRPVMRVVSTVISVRELHTGQSVGYGGTWTASRRSLIATIPIGYADGLTRCSSNNGSVLVRGRRAPIVGAVSMDMITVDVTEIAGVVAGDEVTILGHQKGPCGEDTITAAELARLQGTIPWEVLTSVSRRVPRFYRGA